MHTTAHTAPYIYALPESAHIEMIQLREHLRLLVTLTEVGSAASRHDTLLRPDALAWWFTRLSRDLDSIVDATYCWSGPAANSCTHTLCSEPG